MVDNQIVAYDANDPQLSGHESYILAGLGLDQEKYRINSFEWDGDIYEVDGVKYRNVLAKGERQLNDYSIIYAADVQFEDLNDVYKYQATYERQVEVASDVPTYKIQATATYALVEPELGLDDANSSGHTTMTRVLIITLTAVIVGVLLLVLVFYLKRRRRTLDATTFSDDETRNF